MRRTAASVAATASWRGSRKFRAKPGRTRTSSPLLPSFSTSCCRITWMLAGMAGTRCVDSVRDGEREERDVSSALDCELHLALVAGAVAAGSPPNEPPPPGAAGSERLRGLVVAADRPFAAATAHALPSAPAAGA